MRKIFILIILGFGYINNWAIAQSKWSLGFQAGRTQLVGYTGTSYEQNFDFEAQGMGGVNIQVYGKFNITEKVSILAGGGINNLVSGTRFYGERRNNLGTKGVTPQFFAGFDYNIPFGKSGFGLMPRLTFALTGSNATNKGGNVYVFGPGEFSLGGLEIFNAKTGGYEDRNIYLRELEISASDYKFIHHIRPEISFYKISGHHRISLAAVWAFAPDRDFYIEEYNYLEFKGNRHTAFHRFGGHYTALLLGYEFRF